MRNGARILTALVLIAGGLVVTPTTQAVNADWTPEYATSLTDSVREIALAHDGEKLGMAYLKYSSAAVGFSVRSSAGVWAEKNPAVIAAAASPSQIKVINTGTNAWIVAGLHTGTSNLDLFHSEDDGVTWAQAAGLSASGAYDFIAVSPTKIGLISCESNSLKYRDSTNNGATWSTAFRVDDNVGNPSSSSAVTTGCTSTDAAGIPLAISQAGTGQVAVNWRVREGGGPKAFYAQSTGGNDQFWTVPFFNGGSCPSGCNPVDGATTILPYFVNGVNGQIAMSFPQNGDLLHTVRNGACAQTFPINSRLFLAASLGRGDTESTSGTCNSYTPSSGVWQSLGTASCSASGTTNFERIAGNIAHTFIQAEGHTTACSGVGFEVNLKPGLAAAWARSYDDPSQTIVFDVDMTATKAYAAFVDTAAGGQVKVVSASAPTAAPALGAVATVAVTGLVGFDVDPSGVTAIARTNGGATVRTYGASGLTELQNVGTNCNLAHGVLAISDHVAYFHCSSGSTIDSLNINSPVLGPPAQPVDCLEFPGGVCPSVLTNGDIIHPNGESQIELNGITDFPIDYSRQLDGSVDAGTSSGVGNQNRIMAFAFSTTTGDIGVSIINQFETGQDTTSLAIANIGENTQPVDEMCVTRDLNGKDYLYAVSTLTNAKAWRVDFHKVSQGTAPFEKYAPILTQVFPGTAGTAGANGVACGLDHFAILKSGSLTIWKCREACSNAAITVNGLTGTMTGGIAMADDGKTVSYIANSTSWYLRDTTTGLVNGSGPAPTTGTFKAMKLHGHASSLWIAMSLEIDRYQTSSVIGNGTDQTYIPPCHGASDTCTLTPGSGSGGSSSSAPCGLVCVNDATVPEGFTASAFKGFLGLLLLVGVAAGLFFMSGSIALAGAGVGVGYLMAFFFGLLPLWPIIVLVVLAVAFIMLRMRSGG